MNRHYIDIIEYIRRPRVNLGSASRLFGIHEESCQLTAQPVTSAQSHRPADLSAGH